MIKKIAYAGWLLIFALSFSAHAQQAEGKWSGYANCPYQQLELQVLIARDQQKQLFGHINSPTQFFASNFDHVSLAGTTLSIGADVPGGLHVDLSGPVAGDTWSPTFTQGKLKCSAQFKRDGAISMSKLAIVPSYQTQPMWCWLTVGEMVFRHFGVLTQPTTTGAQAQCDILQLIQSGGANFICSSNCMMCGSMGGGSSREVAGMLSDYPRRLKVLGKNVPRVFSAVAPVLSEAAIVKEIENGRPVIIGISPGGSFQIGQSINPFFPPMHVALIIGQLKSNTGQWYLVNDPYPFHQVVALPANPYMQAGAIPLIAANQGVPHSASYWIRADGLKKLNWTESILVRVEKDSL
jgi:hypothetical protein